MKTLKDFYEEKKRQAHAWPNLLYTFSKPRYRQPLDDKEQETLNKYVKQVYSPRFKKLKEAEYVKNSLW